MAECPIFNAFFAAESAWKEIDRLINAVPAAFGSSGLVPKFKSEDSIKEDWAYSRTGYHFEVDGAIRRQRHPSHFLLMFDLSRQLLASTWPHGRKALFTFAYAPRFETGWEVSHVAIRGDGRLVDEGVRSECALYADGRLLRWTDKADRWCDRAWLFSIPLMNLDGHDAFSREVVAPVTALLKDNREPENALAETNAVRFQP